MLWTVFSLLVVSRRLITAPHPAETTTPVSSNRVTDQRLPAFASVKTRKIDKEGATEGALVKPEYAAAKKNCSQRTDCCASGDAENKRVCQRVTQQDLHDDARQREQATYQKRRYCTGQANLSNNLQLQPSPRRQRARFNNSCKERLMLPLRRENSTDANAKSVNSSNRKKGLLEINS